MRRPCWLGLVVLTGCRFSPAGGADAGPGSSDAASGPPPGTVLFVLDSADELAGTGSNLAQTTAAFVSGAVAHPIPIPGPGTVEPVAYRYGGLVAYGIDDRRVFIDGAVAGWDQLAAVDVDGVGLLAPTGGAFVDAGFVYPAGIRGLDQFTVYFEGELYLPADSYTFQLDVDDDGFVELAPPGTRDFTRLLSADGTAAYTSTTAGWYPIRAGMSQAGGQVRFDLLLQRSSQVSPSRIPAAWLRAPVHHLAGVAEEAWQELLLGSPRGNAVAIDRDDPLVERWGQADPLDVNATGDELSWRWSGQVRAEVGRLDLAVSASAGHRLWVDGVIRSEPGSWGTPVDATGFQLGPAGPSTTTFGLEVTAPGWHDVAVEAYGARSAGPSLMVTGSPPIGAWRPASAAARTFSLDRRVQLALVSPEVGGQLIPVPATVGGGPPPQVLAVDVQTDVVATRWDLTTIRVVPPGAAPIVVRPAAARPVGQHVDSFHLPASAFPPGLDPRGDWRVEVDTGPVGNSVLFDKASLTIHFVGATPAIAPTATYVSPVIDLGATLRLTNVFTDGPPTAAGEITTRARTCADAAGASCGAWRSAAELAALDERGAHAQIQVAFTSDGVRVPIVDRITLWGFP